MAEVSLKDLLVEIIEEQVESTGLDEDAARGILKGFSVVSLTKCEMTQRSFIERY